MNLDARIRNIPAEVQQEYEERAMIRAEKCNEDFLSHYFDIIMCLKCEHIAVASVTRTRRWLGDLQQTITRRICCECGHFHQAHRTPVYRKFAKR